MASTPRFARVPPELAVGALVSAAAIPLGRLFRDGAPGGTVLSAILLALLVAWGSRRLRLSPLTGMALSVVALALFLSFRFFADTLWGPFPTRETLGALAEAIRDGMRTVVDEVAPVPASSPILLFITAGVWATVYLVDAALMLGNPLLAVASALPLYLLPGGLVESPHLGLEAATFLGAAVLVLFADERARAAWRAARAHGGATPGRAGWRWGPAIRIAIVGVLVVVVLTPRVPGFGSPPGLKSRGGGSGVSFNPIVAIRPTLQNRSNRVLFTVKADRPSYYRLTALDTFDGRTWFPADERESSEVIVSPPPVIPRSTIVRQDIRIDALVGSWLPAAYNPIRVDGLRVRRMENETRALLTTGLRSGLAYSVYSRVPELRGVDLDTAGQAPDSITETYLQLPRNTPREIRQIAQRIAGTQSTPYRKAVALQNFLRSFVYDENVAAGNSFNTMLEFLTESRRGYCEQFAATMAVLARTLGIPARVAIGFATGELDGDVWRVRTRQAHAWVEIYFPGYDWVAFEPTPRTDAVRVPAYTALTIPGFPTLPDSPDPLPTAQPRPTGSATPGAVRAEEDGEIGGARAAGIGAWVYALGAAGGLPILAAGLVLVVRRRRHAGMLRAPTGSHAVASRYADFLAWCEGAGLGRRLGETPREHAARLHGVLLSAAAASAAPPPPSLAGRDDGLDALAAMVEQALWAPPNGLDRDAFDRLAAQAQQRVAATLSRRRRVLAALAATRPRP